MKILLVSWSILPHAGGTSIIVENLARNFSKEELIILGGKTMFQNDIPQRTPDSPDFRYFFSEMYFMGRGYRYFKWFREARMKALINHIKKIIVQEKIDQVVGVYPNIYYCLAACRAARQTNTPFSSYFHNTYVENTAIKDPLALQKQTEIFENSNQVFVMSKGMEAYYAQKYHSDKFIPLVHTFNEYPSSKNNTGIPGIQKKHYKLVAIGNFNESNMDATIRFANAIKDHPKYSLSLYTHVPKLLLQKRGLNPNLIKHKGFVGPDEVHEKIQDYDIAVLTHGFEGSYGAVEYQTIFPTRTIPLLLAEKPIIAHSPKGSFLNDFIKANNCAALVEEASEKAIFDQLESITTDLELQKQLVEAAQKTSKLFYGPNVVKAFKSHLKEKSYIAK